MHSKNKIYRSWLEISRSALLHNFNQFRKIVGKKTKIAAVVKAQAYGHGLKEVVSVLKGKTDVFAVDNIDEALSVREIDKRAKVLVLGYVTLFNIKRLVENDISFVIYRSDILRYIARLKLSRKAKIHIKIETGLNRQGVEGKNLTQILTFLKKNTDQIYLEGLYTHFANVEDTLDPSYARSQLKRFNEALKAVRSKGFDPPLVHMAASAAILLFKDSHFDMVRAGLGLYGLWPSRETKIAVSLRKMKISLKPVLSWKSVIAQVKTVMKGESVGYGRTWVAPRRSKIAIVPVGYSDGFDRKLSNLGKIIVRGSLAPVIGRVAMNMIMADVTDVGGIREDDEVIIIGKSGGKAITAEDLAEKIGTINYEVVSRINPMLPKIIV